MEQYKESGFDTELTTRYVRETFGNINIALETLQKTHAQLKFYRKEDWIDNIIEELAGRTINVENYSTARRLFTISRIFVTVDGTCISTSVSYSIDNKNVDLLDPLEIIKSLTRDVENPIYMAELIEAEDYYKWGYI